MNDFDDLSTAYLEDLASIVLEEDRRLEEWKKNRNQEDFSGVRGARKR